MSQRRVVVSGLGAVSCLGVGVGALWDGLLGGRSGLGPITRFDASGFPNAVGGEVKDFSAKDFVPKGYRKAVKVMARDIELAVGAAKSAVEDARVVTRGMVNDGVAVSATFPSERIGCQIGAGLIAAETDELTQAVATARQGENASSEDRRRGGFSLRGWGTSSGADGVPGAGAMNNLPPLWMLKYLPNMPSCHVTIIHGAEGPSNTITCAEASGLLSIGESVRVIERDDADVCFSGGAESKLNLMGMLRMHFAGRLADAPGESDGARLVRPYDPKATGGVLGEGAGILLLEELACARNRTGGGDGRSGGIYAEVVGFGAAHSQPIDWASSDPGRDVEVDEGLQFAVENALDDAKITADVIDAIVPHAPGVPWIDRAERGALAKVFGSRLKEIPIVAVSPNIGECSAGMGGLLAIVGALCVKHQKLPAQIHAGSAPGLNLRAGPARDASLRNVLVCGGSLGGQNAAIVLRAM